MSNEQMAVYLRMILAYLKSGLDKAESELVGEIKVEVHKVLRIFPNQSETYNTYPALDRFYELVSLINDQIDVLERGKKDER